MNGSGKKELHSIRNRLFVYFTALAVAILVVLWLLQIVFFKFVYTNSKINTLEQLSSTLTNLYLSDRFTEAEELANQYECSIALTDITGRPYFFSQEDGMLIAGDTYIPSGKLAMVEYRRLCKEMNEGNLSSRLTRLKTSLNSELFVYCTALPDNVRTDKYLFLVTAVDPLNHTTQVLTNQLLIISIAVLILAAVMSFYLSKQLSAPVLRMVNASKLLPDGKYNADDVDTGSFLELEELSRSLDYASREISQVATLRRELIANTSHDLRTPLTMIKAYAEMIRDLSGDNPEKRNKHLDIIIDETNRLTALVSDMLEISQYETGKLEMVFENVDMNDCIKDVLSKFDVLAERDGYHLVFEPLSGAIVKADRLRITQVLYNLVGNAVSHAGDDKTVIVLLSVIDGMLRVEVTDHGEGIPKEELPHIWERYYRTTESHKRAQIGTGLGLSIVKSILSKHDAKFGVKSTLGKGSTFFFELPVVVPGQDSSDNTAE